MKVKEQLSEVFENKIRTIFEKSQLENISFVAWKNPESELVHIICTNKVIVCTNLDINQASRGFCLVPFEGANTESLWFEDTYYLNSNGEEYGYIFDALKSIQLPVNTNSRLGELLEKSDNFQANVKNAVSQIKDGVLRKVVVAQKQKYKIEKVDVISIFQNLCKQEQAFVSLIYTPKLGIQIGASPEILVKTQNHIFKTVALAGTQPYIENMDLNSASWTQKEIEEQALVSRYIIECFKKIRLREYDDVGPKTVRAGNLLHLKTEFTVDMAALNFPDLPSTMLKLLHPTSAICGSPLEKSKEFIKTHEGFERGYFCGYLGAVNIGNQTSIYVNIRSAIVKNDTVTFYAGAGITEDSIAEKEYQETENKIQFLKSYFNS